MIKYIKYIMIIIYIFIFFGCSKNINFDKNNFTKATITVSNNVSINNENILETNKSENTFFKQSSDIAVVFPSKIIGKYAINATNSIMSYMIYRNKDFKIKVFDTIDEKEESIKSVFNKLEQNGITKVLLLFTSNGVNYLNTIDNIDNFDIYLPLINKHNLDLNIKNVVYGAINYTQQFDKLVSHSNGKIVNLYDNSKLGNSLSKNLNSKGLKILYQKEIQNDNSTYKRFLTNKNKKIMNSTVIVNMPIVKSSIMLSQMNANNINVYNILSTQVNYTPLLLSLTQVKDRQNMIIANSIGNTNSIIEEYNALLNNDITYNWVNYSSTIGIEYLISKDISNFESIKLIDNQILYPIKLFTTTKYSFKHLN